MAFKHNVFNKSISNLIQLYLYKKTKKIYSNITMVQYLGVNDCSFFPSDWIRCLSPFRYTIIYVDSFTCHWGQVGSSCRACGRHNGQSLTIFPTMHLIQCLAFLPHNLPLTYYIHVKIVKFTIKSMICIYGFNFPLIEIFKPFIDPKLFFLFTR